MFLFGHLGVTLALFFILGYLVPGFRNHINYWYVALGAVLPDIIDKLVGRVLFPYSLASGHLIAHTLAFVLILAVAGLIRFRDHGDARILLISGASLLHLLEDRLWTQPALLLWPLFGWGLPHGTPPDNWIDYFTIMFRRSIHPEFSFDFVAEAVGFAVIAICVLACLISRRKARK
ncbi:MAG: metal-dependent hydrolase [Candidatus Methanoperedens sp.]|nr:metal-dependent hydrolase [Candidatus Methanoperedens sp.]MCZ7370623.1 metal-dependent hydrolase [Candidatus Methanoperedens sp.]